MVETLVFETPTPLPEHAEREFTFDNSENQINGKTTIGSLNNDSNLEDSGIGLQEEWVFLFLNILRNVYQFKHSIRNANNDNKKKLFDI